MHLKTPIAYIIFKMLITSMLSGNQLPVLFKSFGIENGLYSTEINDALLVDQTHRLFGSEGQGLIYYKRGNFFHYGVPEGLKVPFVNALALYNSDSLLVASEHEVYFFSQKTKKFNLIATLENSLKIRKFIPHTGRIYFLSNTDELFLFEKNNSEQWIYKPELKNVNKVFLCQSRIFIVQENYHLYEWNNKALKMVYSSDKRILNAIERNGIIYLFTADEIIKIKYPDTQAIEKIMLKKKMSQLYSLQKNKNYIVGLVNPNELFLIDEKDHQNTMSLSSYIFKVFLFDNDELWISESERLKCYLLNSIDSFISFGQSAERGIIDKNIIGDHLYISFGKKVLKCNLKNGKNYLISDLFPLNTGIVFQILPWMDFSLLLNTETGVYHWNRDRLRRLPLIRNDFDIGNMDVFDNQISYLNDKELLIFFKDKSLQYNLNNAWLKHFRLSDSIITLIGPDTIAMLKCGGTSLFKIKSFTFKHINAVHYDRVSKALWVFEDSVIHRISLNSVQRIKISSSEKHPRIIETVGQDSLLVLTDELKLLIYKNSEITYYPIRFSDWLMRNVKINAFLRLNNDIYLIYDGGILKSELQDFLIPLKTQFKIEKLLVNGVQKKLDTLLILKSFENTINIFFEPVSDIFSETNFLFRFIIITDEKRDTVESSVNELYLTSLIPNRYKVLYQLLTQKGELLDEGELIFRIKKPFYNSGYFFLTSSLVIVLVVTFFIRWRMRQLKEKVALKEKLLETETKALRLQMNPHFLYNSLESIEGYILKADKMAAVRHLNKFTRLMRLILEGSDKGYHTIKQEIELLKNYLDLEQMRSDYSFEYQFEFFPDEKLLENLQIPSMVLQPHVENSIIHGLRPLKNRKGLIKISFYYLENQNIIEVVIDDNGVGRQKSSELPIKTDVKSKSLALKINKQRLEYLGQTSKKQLFIKIEDKMDINGLPSGTVVHLALPVVN